MRLALMVFVIVSAPLSGCMSGEGGSLSEEDLDVGPDELVSGHFQSISLESGHDMSVYVPYLVRDPITGFIQNSTVVDIERGDSFSLDLLSPPRVSMLVMLVGEHGRTNWPVREENQSWGSWLEDGGDSGDWGSAVARVEGNGSLDTLNSSEDRGGPVFVKTVQTVRGSTTSLDDGGLHSSGIVHGREVYERLYRITDPTDSLDPFDGKEGYWDRWAGQGNAAYEDAAQYLIAEFSSFGLEVMSHRYEYTDMLGAQNPEAYNVCAYKWGSLYTDEWLVFGAHFDVAPPANLAVLDPHITGIRTYGTRVGAYDNSAGTSMVLETARALSEFESRRTMVFCLWSGEEGGKRGSDYWTDYYVKEDNPDVTVTSYINLDMAGVNWPGGGGAPHGDPDPQIDEDGYPKDGGLAATSLHRPRPQSRPSGPAGHGGPVKLDRLRRVGPGGADGDSSGCELLRGNLENRRMARYGQARGHRLRRHYCQERPRKLPGQSGNRHRGIRGACRRLLVLSPDL